MKAQFEVSEEIWGRIKVAAMLGCKSIGELLEPVLLGAFPEHEDLKREVVYKKVVAGECGKHVGLVVHDKGGATPPPTAKPVVNVVMPSGKYGKPIVEDEPIATVTCFKCKEKVVRWTMDPRGKPWCDSCIQDQKNAIA